jgi:acetaldehyde dehydrogenase (acetylating)
MLHDQDLVSVQEVRTKVEAAWQAWQTYKNFTQQQVDAVVEAIAAAGRAQARPLAEMAVQETGMGNVADKTAKNLGNADLLPRRIRDMKTVGVLRELPDEKIIEIGVPVGVVAAVVPTTNPTSTVIAKSIIALKAGNAVVFSPHPRAKNCTCQTAAILAEAARSAGAPDGLIQCLQNPTLEATQTLMKHPRTAVILATGGSGMVRAAYSSGKPAFGVGPGNVPVFIDTSADIADAVAKVVQGKSFDYGTVCSSEQTVVAERSLRDAILNEFKVRRAFFMNDEQRAAVEHTLFKEGSAIVTAAAVGQSPQKIAEMAGFTIPAGTAILVAEINGVGRQHLLSAEKLSPVLAVHFVDSFEAGAAACETILRFGGLGHTCVIYAKDDARVLAFGRQMPAFRVLVNTPSPQGSVGVTTNLLPSMTLGCGAMGGNITSDNVGPLHLVNVKRIAYAVRTAEEAIPSDASASSTPVIAAAVEKFLAARGYSTQSATAAPRPSAALRPVVESVVDQFLSKRGVVQAAQTAPAAPSCGCSLAKTAEAEPPKSAAPPAPVIQIVDFVCEADVRAALAQNKKIYIGPKTIVTPAARELAGRDEVLVLAQR